jgi:hypothetical protein
VRDFSLTDSGVTAETDWLLEESGFELLVPPVDAGLFGRNGTEITRVRERRNYRSGILSTVSAHNGCWFWHW